MSSSHDRLVSMVMKEDQRPEPYARDLVNKWLAHDKSARPVDRSWPEVFHEQVRAYRHGNGLPEVF